MIEYIYSIIFLVGGVSFLFVMYKLAAWFEKKIDKKNEREAIENGK